MSTTRKTGGIGGEHILTAGVVGYSWTGRMTLAGLLLSGLTTACASCECD